MTSREMGSIVHLHRPESAAGAVSAQAFIIALNDLQGTALRLHRIAGALEGATGAGGAVSHLVQSAKEIGCAAECLLEAVRSSIASTRL